MSRKTFADHLARLRQPLETASEDARMEVLDEVAIRLYGLPWDDLSTAKRRYCAMQAGVDDPTADLDHAEDPIPLDLMMR